MKHHYVQPCAIYDFISVTWLSQFQISPIGLSGQIIHDNDIITESANIRNF